MRPRDSQARPPPRPAADDREVRRSGAECVTESLFCSEFDTLCSESFGDHFEHVIDSETARDRILAGGEAGLDPKPDEAVPSLPEAHGTGRRIVNSAADRNDSDSLVIPKARGAMPEAGRGRDEVRKPPVENPLRFFSPSRRFDSTEGGATESERTVAEPPEAA